MSIEIIIMFRTYRELLLLNFHIHTLQCFAYKTTHKIA